MVFKLKHINIVAAILLVIFLMPLIAYFIIFRGGISTENGDWLVFGSIAAATTSGIAIAANTYVLLRLEIVRDDREKEAFRMSKFAELRPWVLARLERLMDPLPEWGMEWSLQNKDPLQNPVTRASFKYWDFYDSYTLISPYLTTSDQSKCQRISKQIREIISSTETKLHLGELDIEKTGQDSQLLFELIGELKEVFNQAISS